MNIPGEDEAEWETELTQDEPGHRIAWRSTDEDGEACSGWATFADDGEGGTTVEVSMSRPCAALAGSSSGDEREELEPGPDLRRLKDVLETRDAMLSVRTQ